MTRAIKPVFLLSPGNGTTQVCTAAVNSQETAILQAYQIETACFYGRYASRRKLVIIAKIKPSAEFSFYYLRGKKTQPHN